MRDDAPEAHLRGGGLVTVLGRGHLLGGGDEVLGLVAGHLTECIGQRRALSRGGGGETEGRERDE